MKGISADPLRDERSKLIVLSIITLGAFILRIWNLDSIPPGWRDDELINSLVISKKVLDGNLALYYADASGHEALYHALNAIMLGLFGPNAAGIRLLSSLLGTLTILLTYLVGRRLFGSFTGLFAAAMLAVSFWSLMYSRVGIRHILTPVLVLLTFFFFIKGLNLTHRGQRNRRNYRLDFILAGIFMGLGFYTYFAGRGVPLILLAFCIYAFLFARQIIMRQWPGLLLMFGIGLLMAVPLLITLAQQPESEARVAELAVPLVEARKGNFEPLLRHVSVTLSMFHADGDDEWLYNIPHRPLFGSLGAAFFWTGVLIALGYSLLPPAKTIAGWVGKTLEQDNSEHHYAALSSAFLLFWWLAGISPGFISVPPASLGHTILAQPAVYLLAALP
ncbi:MAG: glycosyltransferase family 39 protein, partial [Candidatus Promineifilaceae bacterium]|nr:glycosyltransferase family 39 protein [Candidatus Promineifilaceae bacterium]